MSLKQVSTDLQVSGGVCNKDVIMTLDLSTWPVEYPMRTKLPQAVRVRAVASAVLRCASWNKLNLISTTLCVDNALRPNSNLLETWVQKLQVTHL